MVDNSKRLANKILESHSKYHIYDIAKSSLIHNGYTNISYYFLMNDNVELQIRIGNDNNLVNRRNEIAFLQAIDNTDFIYLDSKNGNAIKKWIKGVNPDTKLSKKLSFIKKLNNKIDDLHKTKVNKKIISHNYLEYLDLAELDKSIKDKYVELVNGVANDPWVISHNDLNPDNIIVNDNQIYFIDYEWARINHPLWDIANYFREVNMPIWKAHLFALINKINWKKLRDYIFICTCYSYQWTFYMNQSEKILKYRPVVKSQMERYFKKFY